MLRCLGCNVPSDGSRPTPRFGDNLSVIFNAQNTTADLSKRYVEISFRVVRQSAAASIIERYWLKGALHTYGIMTNKIPRTKFKEHVDCIYWHTDFHIHNENRLDESHMDTS